MSVFWTNFSSATMMRKKIMSMNEVMDSTGRAGESWQLQNSGFQFCIAALIALLYNLGTITQSDCDSACFRGAGV